MTNLYVSFAAYLGLGLVLLTAGVGLFVLATPKIKEFELIGKRNITAALSLGGKMLGLAIVLGAAAEYSVSLLDMAIWGSIGIFTQIIVFFVAEVVTVRYSLQKAIEEDNRSVGIILFSLSLAVGWIVAKSLSY
jgi:putative membrane protein